MAIVPSHPRAQYPVRSTGMVASERSITNARSAHIGEMVVAGVAPVLTPG
jgi:hypothetical protein